MAENFDFFQGYKKYPFFVPPETDRRIRSRPDILFHYCSPAAFFSIIESGLLRLGRLSAMNDYKELSWIRSIALRELDRLDPSKASDIDAFERFRTRLALLLRETTHTDPYCVCFSEKPDVLSQWRAYAGNAEGFSIGFRSGSLAFGTDGPHPINYSRRLHVADVRLMISLLLCGMWGEGPEVYTQGPEETAGITYGVLVELAVFSKNPKFKEELEFRVAHDTKGALPDPCGIAPTHLSFVRKIEQPMRDAFQMLGSNLRHYLEIEYERSAVVEVYLGPRNPNRFDHAVLRAFLKSNDMEHVKIRKSKASLR